MSSTFVEFLRSELQRLHAEYRNSTADLTQEQWHWRANEHGCHIGFLLWHYYRTQDNIIQFVLQRKPTIWLDAGWDQKFGLDRKLQGTGMSLEEAQALQINSRDDFLAYMDAVAAATKEFLAGIDDEALKERTTVKPLGEMPISNAIGAMCLTHGFTHLGEVQHLRGLQGLRGMSF